MLLRAGSVVAVRDARVEVIGQRACDRSRPLRSAWRQKHGNAERAARREPTGEQRD